MVLSPKKVFEITGLCVNKPNCRVLLAIDGELAARKVFQFSHVIAEKPCSLTAAAISVKLHYQSR